MRFLGGGIGHKATDYLQQATPVDVPDDVSEPQHEDIFPQNTRDHTQANEADDAEGESEEAHDASEHQHEDIFPQDTQDHDQAEEAINAEGDSEEAQTDEEADYGYVDEPEDSGDKGSDSDLEEDESVDSNHSGSDTGN